MDHLLAALLGLLALGISAGVTKMFFLSAQIARLDQKLQDHIDAATIINGAVPELLRRMVVLEARLEHLELRFEAQFPLVKNHRT